MGPQSQRRENFYFLIVGCSMESGCGMIFGCIFGSDVKIVGAKTIKNSHPQFKNTVFQWDAEFEKIKDMTREEATVALIEACGKAVVALQESQYAKSEFEKAQSHLQAIRENHSRTELEEAIAKGNAAMRALCDVDRAAVRLRRFMEALEKHRITDCEGQGASSSN